MAKAPGIKHTEIVELSRFSSKVSSMNPHCICILLKNDLEISLINPKVYTNYGKLFGAPQNAIEPGEFACLGFYRTNYLLFGPEGIVSYDLKDLGTTFCIYFDNPYFGYNKFTMYWMNEGKNVDQDLCRTLSSDKGIYLVCVWQHDLA
ncbi:uncharacterized protein LOC134247579 [Saccostrea cucullata]|uniref:uncharacterized protein LOC134247579 n=1 Tax=Saccostrea cuccullata TaxID=36930 RepID=UPI002ED0FBBD